MSIASKEFDKVRVKHVIRALLIFDAAHPNESVKRVSFIMKEALYVEITYGLPWKTFEVRIKLTED